MRREGAVALLDDQAVELQLGQAALVTSAPRPVASARASRRRGRRRSSDQRAPGHAGRGFEAGGLDRHLHAERVEHVAGAADRRCSARSRASVPPPSSSQGAPGTASTSRPIASAWSAVISAPERRVASTTTVAWASAATIRLRTGKRQGAGYAGPPLRDDRAGRRDAAGERGVAPGVVAVDAAAQHGDGTAAAVERTGVRGRVDAEGR